MSKFADEGKELIEGFPYSLSRSENKAKMAESVCGVLAKTVSESEKAGVFTRIEELPETVLDILAADLKVDWYDYEGALEEKRKCIRECMFIHSYKGTKFAVKTALESVYSKVSVNEWFEPYHFNVDIFGSTDDREKGRGCLKRLGIIRIYGRCWIV